MSWNSKYETQNPISAPGYTAGVRTGNSIWAMGGGGSGGKQGRGGRRENFMSRKKRNRGQLVLKLPSSKLSCIMIYVLYEENINVLSIIKMK